MGGIDVVGRVARPTRSHDEPRIQERWIDGLLKFGARRVSVRRWRDVDAVLRASVSKICDTALSQV